MQAIDSKLDIHEGASGPADNESLSLPLDLADCHLLINALRDLLIEKDSLLQKQDSDLEKLKQHLHNLLRNRFGRSTEKISPDQLLIFAQELLGQNNPQDKPESEDSQSPSGTKSTNRGGGGRNPLSKGLPSEDKDYFPESTRVANR